MRFSLIDRITEYEPGVQLTADKNVSLSEEYLGDHFPMFPVLPGVFMLEAITEAAAWFVRLNDGFKHSIVTLKEIHNIKYADFVQPGSTLNVTVGYRKEEGANVLFSGRGTVDGKLAVSGRFAVERRNLADEDPSKAHIDRQILRQIQNLYQILSKKLVINNAVEPVSV